MAIKNKIADKKKIILQVIVHKKANKTLNIKNKGVYENNEKTCSNWFSYFLNNFPGNKLMPIKLRPAPVTPAVTIMIIISHLSQHMLKIIV